MLISKIRPHAAQTRARRACCALTHHTGSQNVHTKMPSTVYGQGLAHYGLSTRADFCAGALASGSASAGRFAAAAFAAASSFVRNLASTWYTARTRRTSTRPWA